MLKIVDNKNKMWGCEMKKEQGFTLVELLVATGVISLASVGLYGVYSITSDWQKTNQEVKSLNLLISEIENSTSTTGKYTGITNASLTNHNFSSALNLKEVNSPQDTKLNFEYKDISPRVCTEFTSKMIASAKNKVTAIINGDIFDENNITHLAAACNASDGNSDVTIVVNKELPAYTIDTVVASVNFPESPPPDITIPLPPTPTPLPNIPSFTAPTAVPIVYGITGAAPVYPVIPPISGGGPPIAGPNTGSGAILDTFIPPELMPLPPPAAAPPDDVDGEVLPPIKTTESRNVSCPSGYTGSITEQRTRTLYQGSGNVTYSAWVAVSNNCVEIPKDLAWAQGYELHGKGFSYQCRAGLCGSSQPMYGDQIGDIGRFNKEFTFYLYGGTWVPNSVSVKLTRERFDEMARNGYHFYYILNQMTGPGNWEQFTRAFVICKLPKKGVPGRKCQ